MSFFHVDLPSVSHSFQCVRFSGNSSDAHCTATRGASMEASVLWSMACCTSWLRLLRLLLLSQIGTAPAHLRADGQ